MAKKKREKSFLHADFFGTPKMGKIGASFSLFSM
jgi:hypothetical protein